MRQYLISHYAVEYKKKKRSCTLQTFQNSTDAITNPFPTANTLLVLIPTANTLVVLIRQKQKMHVGFQHLPTSPGSPFCIIRAAVFMVSPKRRKRGKRFPTTPATTGPVWIPIFTSIEEMGCSKSLKITQKKWGKKPYWWHRNCNTNDDFDKFGKIYLNIEKLDKLLKLWAAENLTVRKSCPNLCPCILSIRSFHSFPQDPTIP